MSNARCIVRTTSVTAEDARRARASAWAYIFACHKKGRAPQHARLVPSRNKGGASNDTPEG